MGKTNNGIIIVGAGLAGLSCACRLMEANLPFVILEAGRRVGGRIKTDQVDGFLLDQGFQVLQTAYPEARKYLDYNRLELNPFAPGAIIRTENKFYVIADPRRRPQALWNSATAPIGTMGDRLRIIKLASKVRRAGVADLFQSPEMSAIEFLRADRFTILK